VAARKGTKAEGQESEREEREGGLFWLWAGVLVPPMALLSHMQVNYTLTQQLCPGGRTLWLHLVTILFLLITAGIGLIAWRAWGRAGRLWPDESENRKVRNRFMAAVGLLISGLSFLVILAQWIPQFIFNPCQR
jgi:hypothetical protein